MPGWRPEPGPGGRSPWRCARPCWHARRTGVPWSRRRSPSRPRSHLTRPRQAGSARSTCRPMPARRSFRPTEGPRQVARWATCAAMASRTQRAPASSTERTLTWRTRLPVPFDPAVRVRKVDAVGELQVDVRLVRDDREGEVAHRSAGADRQEPVAAIERLDRVRETLEDGQAQGTGDVGDRGRGRIEMAVERERRPRTRLTGRPG